MHITLTHMDAKILEAQLLDGADTHTVAKRAGVHRDYANKRLTRIAQNFYMKRMEMVVAFLRGELTYSVAGPC